jgi:hypothetical protein
VDLLFSAKKKKEAFSQIDLLGYIPFLGMASRRGVVVIVSANRIEDRFFCVFFCCQNFSDLTSHK